MSNRPNWLLRSTLQRGTLRVASLRARNQPLRIRHRLSTPRDRYPGFQSRIDRYRLRRVTSGAIAVKNMWRWINANRANRNKRPKK